MKILIGGTDLPHISDIFFGEEFCEVNQEWKAYFETTDAHQ